MIRLRPAEKADLTSLYELDQICFPAGIAYSLSDFRALLRSSRVLTIIAEQDSILAGFAMAQMATLGDILVGLIVTIDVAPLFRRRGVGASLMQAIETGVQAVGAEVVRLEVAVDNQMALSFYEKLGFIAVGELPGYYPTGTDAIVMQKPLNL